jgi:hypothetical protein
MNSSKDFDEFCRIIGELNAKVTITVEVAGTTQSFVTSKDERGSCIDPMRRATNYLKGVK